MTTNDIVTRITNNKRDLSDAIVELALAVIAESDPQKVHKLNIVIGRLVAAESLLCECLEGLS